MRALSLLTLLAVAAPVCTAQTPASQPAQPVLGFPDAGLDDTVAYRGYQTRFYRDAARNTLQLYVDERSARVVHLFADADNASIGFTARDGAGKTAPLVWGPGSALVSRRSRARVFEHQLLSSGTTLHLGWFLLGSMRVERDFQHFQRARESFANAPYRIPEVDRLIASLDRLPADVRARHLQRLNARSAAIVRARMYPRPALARDREEQT